MSKPVEPRQSSEPAKPKSAPGVDDETLAILSGVSEEIPLFGPPSEHGDVGRLGPYRVIKELGRGGMGVVYAAIDTRLDRKLALKVMLPQFAANPAAKERFLREARAAAKISHDNVVTVYEADERDGVPYIAMQFLQGYPLDEFLKKKGNPSFTHVLRIARETAAGLSAAHNIGLVHRDIKPANLWLEAPNGRVKVLDFGLAKPVDAEVELTKSGAIVGTPAYMSPEQARGEKVDHRTDLFSLGGVLYRLCTGRLPFQGANTMAVLMALGTEEPPPVRALNPNVPEPLAALIHQLLAKKPDARPQSSDEVVKRLRAIGEELSTPVAAEPQVVYVPMQITAMPEANPFEDIDATEAEPDATEAEPAPPPARKPNGAKWVLIGSGVVAILVVAIAGFLAFKGKGQPEKKDETANKEKDVKALPGPKTPPAVADPDRKAAEYVLSVGGLVRVNGAADDIKLVSELLMNPFTLTYVNLAAKQAVTDAGLACFKGCKGLTYLDLTHSSNKTVTDAGLAHFKDCKDLRDLRLAGTMVTDAGLLNFKDCKGLTVLDLSGTPVTDSGLTHLRNFPALAGLLLYFSQVTDAGLVHLKGLPALTNLWLVNSQVTDAGLVHLKTLPALTSLSLDNTAVSDKGLAALKECRGLSSLSVTNTKVTPQGLADFHAALPGCRIDYTGGVIEAVDVDRKAAEWALAAGGTLQVNGAEVKGDASKLPKERFVLQSVSLTADAKATTPASESLKHCKGLTWLLLHGSDWTDVRLQEFKGLTGLTTLQLWYVPASGLGAFKDCEGLAGLTLNYSNISDVGLEQVAGFKKLSHLSIVNTRVTDKGLAHLKGVKSLVSLKVGGTMVTAKGLADFHAAVPGCQIEYDGGIIVPKK